MSSSSEKKMSLNEKGKVIGDKVFPFLQKHDYIILLLVITVLSLFLRIKLLDRVTGDYSSFLSPWYNNIYTNGFSALGKSFGDYTPAYYYFLWMLTWFKLEPQTNEVLYGIKFVSIFFDYSLAISVYFLVYELTRNRMKAALGYSLVICCVMVFLNSAWWGQCDAIYVSFLIWSIYFLMKDRQGLSMMMFSFSFCFKLQSVFLLPVFLILALKRKFKIRYFFLIPIIYSLVALPACFASDSFFERFMEIWSVYFNQSANSYRHLSLNCGSLYALIFTNFKEEESISAFAVFLAVAIVGTYVCLIFHSKKELTKERTMDLFVLFGLLVPYVLPHMHERYLYMGDVLIIIYILMHPKRFYLAFLAWIDSMIGYMVYLWNVPFINVVPQEQSDPTKALSFRFGAILYLICISFVSYFVFYDLYKEEKVPLKDEKRDILTDGLSENAKS